MRLIDQFRVQGPDGILHTIARYRHGHTAPYPEATAGPDEFRLNGSQAVTRIDDDTFVTARGQLLRRAAHR